MGYDFDWNVSGAMIVATSEDLDLPIMLGEGSDPT